MPYCLDVGPTLEWGGWPSPWYQKEPHMYSVMNEANMSIGRVYKNLDQNAPAWAVMLVIKVRVFLSSGVK